MKPNKNLINLTILTLTLILILSTTAYAKPFTDSFRGGLLQINDFFAGEQYKPYSTAIDFFFFALLFIAIYMMGARYAFKEVKRAETLIVILLGLMTAFLLVLGGFSATILLSYIGWIFYILLFILYWWLLKGIKNKFWRFILALLLTLLTIGLIQVLFGAFAPDTEGFFKSFAKSFEGIQFPGIGAPGVPTYLQDLFGAPTPTPTEPAPSVPTPPQVPTPTTPAAKPGEKGGFPWWGWALIVLAIALGGFGAYKFWPRRGAPTPNEELTVPQIIQKIEEIIWRKQEAIRKIKDAQARKNSLLQDAIRQQTYVQKLAEIDLADLFTDPGRNKIKAAHQDYSDIFDEESNIIYGLRELRKVEVELFDLLDKWKEAIQREKNIDITQIVNNFKNLITAKVPVNDIANDTIHLGILRIIELIYDIEKRELTLDREQEQLLREDKIEELVKGKLQKVIGNIAKLNAYNKVDSRIIYILNVKVEFQINKLGELRILLGATLTPPQSEKYNASFDPKEIKLDRPYEDRKRPIDQDFEPPEPLPTVPVFKDLSRWFQRIKHQRSLGACVAFAACSIYEYNHNRSLSPNNPQFDPKMDLSELFHYYDIRQDKEQDEGAYPSVACDELVKLGVCKEDMWPYVIKRFAEQPDKKAYEDASNQKIIGHYTLPIDKNKFIQTLLSDLPILIAINVYSNLHIAHGNDYIEDSEGSASTGRLHAIVVCGYKSAGMAKDGTLINNPNDKEAFKIRNSWGEGWGDKGYIWINADYLMSLLHGHGLIAPRVLVGRWFDERKKEPKKQKAHTLIPHVPEEPAPIAPKPAPTPTAQPTPPAHAAESVRRERTLLKRISDHFKKIKGRREVEEGAQEAGEAAEELDSFGEIYERYMQQGIIERHLPQLHEKSKRINRKVRAIVRLIRLKIKGIKYMQVATELEQLEEERIRRLSEIITPEKLFKGEEEKARREIDIRNYILTLSPLDSEPADPIEIISRYHTGRDALKIGRGRSDIRLVDANVDGNIIDDDFQAAIVFLPEPMRFAIFKSERSPRTRIIINNNTLEEGGAYLDDGYVYVVNINEYDFTIIIREAPRNIPSREEYRERFLQHTLRLRPKHKTS